MNKNLAIALCIGLIGSAAAMDHPQGGRTNSSGPERPAQTSELPESWVLFGKFLALGDLFEAAGNQIPQTTDAGKRSQLMAIAAHGQKMKADLTLITRNNLVGRWFNFENEFLRMVSDLAKILKIEVLQDDREYELRLLDIVIKKMTVLINR